MQQETEETCNQNILQNMKLIVPYSWKKEYPYCQRRKQEFKKKHYQGILKQLYFIKGPSCRADLQNRTDFKHKNNVVYLPHSQKVKGYLLVRQTDLPVERLKDHSMQKLIYQNVLIKKVIPMLGREFSRYWVIITNRTLSEK